MLYERRYALRIMEAFACGQVRRLKSEESPMFLNLPNVCFVVAQFFVVFVLFFIFFITNIITIICESQRCHKLYAAHSPLWESEEQRYWSGCCPVWLVAVPAARPVPGVARLGGYSAACADR